MGKEDVLEIMTLSKKSYDDLVNKAEKHEKVISDMKQECNKREKDLFKTIKENGNSFTNECREYDQEIYDLKNIISNYKLIVNNIEEVNRKIDTFIKE